MIRAVMTADGHCGRILIAPNRSSNWQANATLLGVVMMVSLLIGMASVIIGAWLIVPFLVAEMLLLGAALYWLLSRLQCQQLLVIGPQKVVVAHRRCRVVLSRQQARLLIEAPQRFTDWQRLSLLGNGHSISLGAFLNEQESGVLCELLRETGLRSVRQQTCLKEF